MPPEDDYLRGLLLAFLRCDPEARDELPKRVGAYVRHRATRLTPDDLRRQGLVDDVVNRTWELLLRRPPGHFDPERGTVFNCLSNLVATAVRDIRAQSLRGLRRTREYATENPLPAHGVMIVFPRASLAIEPVVQSEVPAAEARVALERALADQPEAIRRAVAMVAFADATVTAAAEACGMNRFTLKRRLEAWAKDAGAGVLVA